MSPRRVHHVIAFCWVIGAAGGLILLHAVTQEGLAGCAQLTFAVLFAGVLLGEMAPLRLPLRGGDEELNLSTPLVLALLVHAGLAPALIAQVIASVVQDVIVRKPLWRVAFNIGQYVLSLGAGYAVLRWLGVGVADPDTLQSAHGLGALIAAGIAFFVVNFIVVGYAVATYQGIALGAYMRSDLKTTMVTAGVSISLAPLVLAALNESVLLLALFLLPLAAVHSSARVACDSAHRAMHDALTGLPNRLRFQQLVHDAIGRAKGSGEAAVMLLDLNRFKEVNDTLGHRYGDLLLQTTASRLAGALAEGDVVSRLGGDEFAILVHGDDPESVAARLGDALRAPVEVDGLLLEVSASIGTARYPHDGDDLESLLRGADVAMYAAKSRHLGHVFYSSDIDEYDPERLALVADLRRALDEGELTVFYQPKLDLARGTITAVEALVRWDHPRLGLLSPSAFIDMAEHTGLIKPLTQNVLEQAVRQAAAWQREGRELQVAVNVSPRSLLDRELPEMVAAALARRGLRPGLLELEITESVLMADPSAALQVLHQLDAMGVSLSIDDFGTGYSSLAYLSRLPVKEVKIDRSFVGRMAHDARDHAIVHSTVALAANLHLRVVAEGVEDAQTLETLERLGCDQVQGYFISRPLPAAELTAWLAAYRPPAPVRELQPAPLRLAA